MNGNVQEEEVIIKYRSQPQSWRNMKWAEFAAPFRVDADDVWLRSFVGVYKDKVDLLSSN